MKLYIKFNNFMLMVKYIITIFCFLFTFSLFTLCNQNDGLESMSKYSDSKSAIETSIEILDVNSNNVIAIIYIDRITDEVVSLIGEEQRVQKLFLQNYYSTPQSIESKFLDFRSEIPVFSYAQNKNSTVHYRGTNKAKVVAVANEVLNSEGCVQIEKNGDIYVVKSCKK